MNHFVLGFIVVVYMLAIAFLGYLGFKHTKSTKDYLLGGREIHPMIMALSYGSTFISTAAIVGFGGISAVYGMGLIWLTFLNIFIGIFIAFIFFGKRTRRMGHNLDAHTFPEFLGLRFKSKSIQMTSGILIFLSMPVYAAVVLIGGARFLQDIFEMEFSTALVFFTIVVAAYVITGGLKGVMYTDALQGGIMFFCLLFLLALTYLKLGGFTSAHQELTNMTAMVPESLKAQGHVGWTSFPKFNSPWWWVLTTNLILGVGIGVLAQPQLVVRFMTVKSNRELNRAILAGGIFIFVATGFVYTAGALSNVYFHRESGQLAIAAAGGNVDLIIPKFINSAMPPWLIYTFMVALLSAAMSTLSSQFHTMGSAAGRDLYEQLVPSTKRSSMFISRAGIFVSILISLLIAYKLPEGIIARGTAIFFGICAATFLPAYFAGLYWKKATTKGVIWSMISGIASSVFVLVFMHQKEAAPMGICKALFGKDFLIDKFPWMIVDPIMIALPLAIIVLIVVSLMTPKLPEEHVSFCHKGIQ